MERIHSFDFMKGFAIIIVVFFHTMSHNAESQSEYGNLLLYVFPRFIIPFFFIVSGYLFGMKIKNRINQTVYFKSYTLKLIKIFISWHLLYLIYDFMMEILYSLYKGADLKTVMEEFVVSNLNLEVIYYGEASASYHLWFLTALIWSIIILYIFIKFGRLKYLFVISLMLNILGLFGQTYSGIFYLSVETMDALFLGLFYTTAGCFIAYHIEKFKRYLFKMSTSFIFFLFILSSFIQMIESYITVVQLDGTRGGVGYYLSTIPLTLSLFMLLIKNSPSGKRSIVTFIGRNTLGIYLTHMIFVGFAYYVIHFLNMEGLRKYFIFNLLLSVMIIALSHYSYLFIQACKNKVLYLNKNISSRKGLFAITKRAAG
ncbi:acyltransferase [Bacillus sp. IITD106]|nr:acyltransferase [Bacillus sp. IITD106]